MAAMVLNTMLIWCSDQATFAQGKLLVDQAGARFVRASMTCFVARDIITLAQ